MRITYRLAKKVVREIRKGPSVGSTQYIARQVYHLDRTKPGGNYANPKRRRS